MKENLSNQDLQVASLFINYVGNQLFDDILLSSDLISELSKDGSSIQKMPSEGDKFIPSEVTAKFNTTDNFRPGQTVRIGQRGYDLVIFRYTFNGNPGGHVSGHSPNYNNNLPREWRATSGQYRNIRFGPACGSVLEHITVYRGGQSGSASATANIIQVQLNQIGNSSNYHLIGSNPMHPSNHWGSQGTIAAINSIAAEYKAQTGDRLYINDMSLKWGGLFDISGKYSPSHHEHRDGRQVDIAATKTTLRHEEKFLKILRKYTSNYILEGSGRSRHYHVRF